MNDSELLNALQAIAEEHFDREASLGFDVVFGALTFTVRRPVVYVANSPALLQSGEVDLRATLEAALKPHLARLVTRALLRP